MKKLIFPIVIIIILAISLFLIFPSNKTKSADSDPIIDTINNLEIKVTSDGTKYSVDPEKIISGGVPKGGIGINRGIPALDAKNIKFETVEQANKWIEDNALVLAINYRGTKRVYPVQILTFHEIANDEINKEPILVTYCPLCGSGIAYRRTISIDGTIHHPKFGTSGKLYNSNLVMYDEITDTYWTQIGGNAIVGPLTGQSLSPISLETTTWIEWKTAHPESQVLSKDTGFSRPYSSDKGSYANYFEDDFYLFPGIENKDQDRKLANKEFVYGIEISGKFKAYPKKIIDEIESLEDNFAETKILITRAQDGTVKFTNLNTGEEIIKEVDFWFAWFAFHPDTDLYLE
jgi:hypothetical protein